MLRDSAGGNLVGRILGSLTGRDGLGASGIFTTMDAAESVLLRPDREE